MSRERKGRTLSDPALSSPPSDSTEHNCNIERRELDLALVGENSDIWAALFDGKFRLAVRCDVCGRWLTAGKSKSAGRGPNCAARSAVR